MKEYKASLDGLAKALTFIVYLIVLAVALSRFVYTKDAGSFEMNYDKWAFLIALIVLFSAYPYRVKKYIITDDSLIVKRLIGSKKIPLKEIASARLLETGELKLILRTFGSGGFYGYFGKYYDSHLGVMTFYTTQRENRILVELKNGKKIVLSPDDVTMVDALQPKGE
jgi:hypothetical protein